MELTDDQLFEYVKDLTSKVSEYITDEISQLDDHLDNYQRIALAMTTIANIYTNILVSYYTKEGCVQVLHTFMKEILKNIEKYYEHQQG